MWQHRSKTPPSFPPDSELHVATNPRVRLPITNTILKVNTVFKEGGGEFKLKFKIKSWKIIINT